MLYKLAPISLSVFNSSIKIQNDSDSDVDSSISNHKLKYISVISSSESCRILDLGIPKIVIGVVRTEYVTRRRVSVATTSDIPLQFTPVVKIGHRGNLTA